MPNEVDGQVEPTLPSDEVETPSFDTYLENNRSENGKLFGRFDTPEQALDHFREQEVKHTNNMRDLKDEQKQHVQDEQSVQDAKQQETDRIQKLGELTPAFIENGMNMTPELKQAIMDGGLSEAEVELGAYKLRDSIDRAYSVVGGKEEYTAMLQSEVVQSMDDETKAEFDLAIKSMIGGKSTMGVLAIEGMYARYKAGDSGEVVSNRVEGHTAPNTVSGYKTQAEMLKDKRAADKNPALRKAYSEKMGRTSDSVVYGR